MKKVSFKPAFKLIKIVAILALAACLLSIVLAPDNAIIKLFISLIIALLGLVLFDLFSSMRTANADSTDSMKKSVENNAEKKGLSITRQLPNNLSFNYPHTLSIKLTNHTQYNLLLSVTDCVPKEFEISGLATQYRIKAGQTLTIPYKLTPLKRGEFQIGPIELVIFSRLELWQVHWQDPVLTQVKVYPNFNRINQSESLKGVNNLPTTGLKKLSKRGDGIEFHQLREFRQGDSIRQIDWQATSRRQKLISREYQEEQNQHIIVMLDAGNKMNLETEMGTHFDAALNALLMLSHTILKQGDWFSMQSFNLSERWLPAVKGAQNVSRVMNHFYDLHPDDSATDYLKAVNNLLLKRTKRSLVLLVTALNDQDINELLPAIKRLQQYHLVALINIENITITNILNQDDIQTESDANQYCAAIELNNIYQLNLARLAKEGVIVVNTKPEYLLPHVVNTYLNVKHSGIL